MNLFILQRPFKNLFYLQGYWLQLTAVLQKFYNKQDKLVSWLSDIQYVKPFLFMLNTLSPNEVVEMGHILQIKGAENVLLILTTWICILSHSVNQGL